MLTLISYNNFLILVYKSSMGSTFYLVSKKNIFSNIPLKSVKYILDI